MITIHLPVQTISVTKMSAQYLFLKTLWMGKYVSSMYVLVFLRRLCLNIMNRLNSLNVQHFDVHNLHQEEEKEKKNKKIFHLELFVTHATLRILLS